MKLAVFHKKRMLVSLVVGIGLIGFVLFAKFFQVVLPYDPDRMKVTFPSAIVVKGQEGKVRWIMLRRDLDPVAVREEGFPLKEVLTISCERINRLAYSGNCGRTIMRDGEAVRVIYFRCTKTLWDRIFFGRDLPEGGDSYWSSPGPIYGDRYETADYEPQMFEIYYLPIRDIYGMKKLSDEEFDQKREGAILVWKGIN